MPIVLRNRPECHYCGKRNKPSNSQKFKCQHCLADNFLDENGEITDVPVEIAASPRQYAYPAQSYTTDTIFCSTCLKNQAFYTAALSEFLPDPDDDEYEKFEAALPEFKKRLERQYPQCCARCEPKVRAQLQQATYNARTDHLRRVLQKSRARRVANRLGWRSLLVFIAGTGNLLSLLTQLVWHAFGSQSTRTVTTSTQPWQCFQQWPFPQTCADLAQQYIGVSLFVGLVCVWWNPQWQSRLQGRAERLKGLSTYYRFQAMILTIRFVAWLLIKDVPALGEHRPKLHSVFLVFITLLAVYGMTLVQIDNVPLVNWQQAPTPILVQGQFEPSLITPPSSQENFTLNSLRTTSDTEVAPWRPPTPPSHEEDAMDWDPSPATFTPQPKKMTYKSTQPTPFHGALPQVPRGSVFARAAPVEQPKPIGIPMGFFDKPKSEQKTRLDEKALLAQPKFFPNNDRADTGLENIFGKVFSLHDESVEVRTTAAAGSNGPGTLEASSQAPQRSTSLSTDRLCSAIIISILLPLTIYISICNFLGTVIFEQTNLLSAVLVAPILHTIRATTTQSTIHMAALHLLFSGGVIGLLLNRPESQSLLLPLWNKLTIGSLWGLSVQEIYNFCVEEVPTKQASSIAPSEPDLPAETYVPAAATRRGSVSSVASESSIATTSTASGWKTPVPNHRLELANASRSHTAQNTFGLGSLGINDFSVGSNVAGPRNRRTGQR